jgi:hypothetical protein
LKRLPDYTAHQFNIFPYTPPKLGGKKKISTERIRAAQAELAKGKAGNKTTIIQGLRDLNDRLENWEQRIK